MDTFLFFYMLLVHYIADFWLQTDRQAQQKSTSTLYLTKHVATYSLICFIALMAIRTNINWDILKVLSFTCITFGTHLWIDFFTSKASKYYFSKKEYHYGFMVIGFDQILHYTQLFLTYKFIVCQNL